MNKVREDRVREMADRLAARIADLNLQANDPGTIKDESETLRFEAKSLGITRVELLGLAELVGAIEEIATALRPRGGK